MNNVISEPLIIFFNIFNWSWLKTHICISTFKSSNTGQPKSNGNPSESHMASFAFWTTRTPHGKCMFYIFYKHVLLLACPWALVTSVWLQQSPFMSRLIHFIWLTIGLVSQFLLASQLAIGLTLSSTSLPERPVNGVNIPRGLVRGWHLRVQIFSSEDYWENRQHGKMTFLFRVFNTKYISPNEFPFVLYFVLVD